MKKRKSPFGLIAVLAILLVAVIMMNARSHADPQSPQDQANAAPQGDMKAPDAATLSKQLSAQVKDKKLAPKKPKMERDNARPTIVNPYADQTNNPNLKPKIDTNGVQGGWYQKDSGLTNYKK
jgi:hypothetical protein